MSAAPLIIAAHPSLAGIATDTGLSGSTAWHNSVRARMYFKAAPGDDTALRVLECKKNNYGPVTSIVLVRWKDGVYVVQPGVGSLQRVAAEQDADHLFLKLLHRLADQGRNVSDKVSSSYAPTVFASEPDAQDAKASKKVFAEAMARLFKAGKIRVVPFGPASKMRSRIVEVERQDGQETATILPFPTPSNARSDDLPTPSDDLPRGCDPTPPIPPSPLEAGKRALEAPPDPTGAQEGYSARVEVGDRDGPARRPRITGDLELIGVEPPGTACVHCGQADGTPVYLVRDPRQGVASQPLHESCAAAFFKRGGS